jgi:hypothetical protein
MLWACNKILLMQELCERQWKLDISCKIHETHEVSVTMNFHTI